MPLETVSFRGRTLRAYHMDTSAYGTFSIWARELPIRPGADVDRILGHDTRVFLESKGVIDRGVIKLRGIQRDVVPALLSAGFRARQHSLFGGPPSINEVREAIGGRLMLHETFIPLYKGRHSDVMRSLLSLLSTPGYVKTWNADVAELKKGYRTPKFDLSGMDLSGLEWNGVVFPYTDFTSCNMKRISMVKAAVSGSLWMADLDAADLTRARIPYVHFAGANITAGTKLRGAVVDVRFAEHFADHPDRKSWKVASE